MRSKVFGAVLLALAMFAVYVSPAGAVVANTTEGRVSYLPLNGTTGARGQAPTRSTVPTGEPPLEYHGGPVMHSHAAYAIFWAPSGYSFPAGYTAAITEYLERVAADSGKPSNVYSVSAQYTDGSGHATYSDTYGGSVNDTHAYPTSGTCPAYNGFGESFTACVSDQKMEAEVETVVSEHSFPEGLGAEYYVVLPPKVGSCFEVAPEDAEGCFDTEFCAYHSYSVGSTEAIYANISYSPGDPEGCGVEQYPNGNSNGNVDDTLSSLSHEANESITDPRLNAWYDEEGFENGDECRNTPSHEDFGAPLGGSSGTLFNQSIGGGNYYLQREWSNDIDDCAQRVGQPTPQIANPGQAIVGQPVSFDGSGSAPGDGGIVSYEWDFDDGDTANGPKPVHAFSTTGAFLVTLTLADDGGFTSSTSREVIVAATDPGGGGEEGTGGGGGGSSGGDGLVPVVSVGGTPILTSRPKALKCRKGFKKGKRHGKPACLKKKHRKHR